MVNRLFVRDRSVQVKIEVTPVLRGCVYEPEERIVLAAVEERFGFAAMQVLSFPDLYAGKLVAGLDRQHPRDLFDIAGLLSSEGIDEPLRTAFVVYLISHGRPIAELLAPARRELDDEFARGFAGMVETPVTVEDLLRTREARALDHPCGRRRRPVGRADGPTPPAPGARSCVRTAPWHAPPDSREASQAPPRAPRYGFAGSRPPGAARRSCSACAHPRPPPPAAASAAPPRRAAKAPPAPRGEPPSPRPAPPSACPVRSRTAAARTAPWRASRSRRDAIPPPAASPARTATPVRFPGCRRGRPAFLREGRTGSKLPNRGRDHPQVLCRNRHAYENNACRTPLPALRHRTRADEPQQRSHQKITREPNAYGMLVFTFR